MISFLFNGILASISFINHHSIHFFMENLLPIEKAKRETVNKLKTEFTSEKYGLSPDKRPIKDLIDYGIINIDKPDGPTSHQVSYYVQKILNLDKSGHSGTLDPGVTGILPVATGRATRIVQALLPEGKEYIGIMHLHQEVPEDKIREACQSFVGKIKQLPPIRSAVKRQMRYRNVYYFEILEIEEKDIFFRVGTQAGTYIRKLCHDIGAKLGTGAHMSELRRTKVGHFNESNIVTMHDLADAYWLWKNEGNEKFIRKCIHPIEYAVKLMPKIWVRDSAVDTICHGANLGMPGIVKLETGIEKDRQVAFMTLKGELVGLGKSLTSTDDMLKKEKGLAAKTEKVFMLPGTYPKMDKTE